MGGRWCKGCAWTGHAPEGHEAPQSAREGTDRWGGRGWCSYIDPATPAPMPSMANAIMPSIPRIMRKTPKAMNPRER